MAMPLLIMGFSGRGEKREAAVREILSGAIYRSRLFGTTVSILRHRGRLATPSMESAANGRLAALRTNDAVQPRASCLADSVESRSLDQATGGQRIMFREKL
jgi:hypothetical protein